MADCNHVIARGGRTNRNPCRTGVCGMDDVDAWHDSALAWVQSAEREASTPEQESWTAEMRRRYAFLDTTPAAPWNWGQRVQDYILICQQISCALVPVWEQKSVEAKGEVEPSEPTPPSEDEPGWFEWLPTLPGFPSLPSLPGLPGFKWPSFTWPTIPDWAWWVGGGLIVLYLWPKDD